MWIGQQVGQGWVQLGELGLAFVLSALIGAEREIRHKSAGLRTYTLVGFGAALIMLVSKYGFMNILVDNRVVLDPSRIAAHRRRGVRQCRRCQCRERLSRLQPPQRKSRAGTVNEFYPEENQSA
jgi:hypothetical protein